MRILGISAFYHDSAAALVVDGNIVAAAQEERFTRVKQDSSFPTQAIQYCLNSAGTSLDDVDHVIFYDKPFLKFERLIESYLAFAPRGFNSFRKALPLWLKEKLFLKNTLLKELNKMSSNGFSNGSTPGDSRLLFSEHHLSHAASAFFPSPFSEAAVLTMDGVGEWATTSLAIGRDNKLEILKEIHFPHSLGLLYSAFTSYTGFKVNSGEYKMMGLAPYGHPTFSQLILDHLIDVKEDGSFRMDMSYFDYCSGLTMTNRKFDALFGGPPRKAETPITQRDMNLAASIQNVIETIILKLAASIAKETGLKNLCLAGGVALNAVANGKILKNNLFDNIWIQPAAGDAGGALGAALAAFYIFKGQIRKVHSPDAMNGAYLGPEFSQSEIENSLLTAGAKFEVLSADQMIAACANALSEEKALGWFQGRMEFGPRALGARSILGDPRSPKMQSTLNQKIKYRESFRPFAPSVLREDLSEWFDLNCDSPYMLLVADVAEHHKKEITLEQKALLGIEILNVPRSDIPAVTHVDDSARIQTVHKETNPKYHALISRFKELTNCPVLANTSFNVRGEPVVGTPEDAFRCFMGTELDVLAIGNCFLRKEQQDIRLKLTYTNSLSLD